MRLLLLPVGVVEGMYVAATLDSIRVREKGGLSYDVYAHVGWNQYERNSTWVGGATGATGTGTMAGP